MKGTDNILNQLNGLKDALEKVAEMTNPLADNMQKLIDQAEGDDKETIIKFVNESNGLVQDSKMDFGTKLMKLNELKAKYGVSSNNK